MKIAVCGTPSVGKTRFVENFVKQWPGYKITNRKPEDSKLYVPESRADLHSLDKIFQEKVDEAMFYEGKADVLHDGCLVDALAHIFMFFLVNDNADRDILKKYEALFNTAISFYDIIFYISFNNKVNQEANGDQEMTKEEFLFYTGLDNVYGSIIDEYNDGNVTLFPFDKKEGCPPLIELAGSDSERIKMATLYVNKDGSAYGKEDSLIADFLGAGKKPRPGFRS